jgi:hypothetical protein
MRFTCRTPEPGLLSLLHVLQSLPQGLLYTIERGSDNHVGVTRRRNPQAILQSPTGFMTSGWLHIQLQA